MILGEKSVQLQVNLSGIDVRDNTWFKPKYLILSRPSKSKASNHPKIHSDDFQTVNENETRIQIETMNRLFTIFYSKFIQQRVNFQYGTSSFCLMFSFCVSFQLFTHINQQTKSTQKYLVETFEWKNENEIEFKAIYYDFFLNFINLCVANYNLN